MTNAVAVFGGRATLLLVQRVDGSSSSSRIIIIRGVFKLCFLDAARELKVDGTTSSWLDRIVFSI
jgi:hypothetical protein